MRSENRKNWAQISSQLPKLLAVRNCSFRPSMWVIGNKFFRVIKFPEEPQLHFISMSIIESVSLLVRSIYFICTTNSRPYLNKKYRFCCGSTRYEWLISSFMDHALSFGTNPFQPLACTPCSTRSALLVLSTATFYCFKTFQ